MLAALVGDAGLLGVLLGALASFLNELLADRRRDDTLKDLGREEQANAALLEQREAAQAADRIREDMRASGFHGAVDQL